MAGEMVIAGIPNLMETGEPVVGQYPAASLGGSHADQEPSSVSIASAALPVNATFQVFGYVAAPVDFVSIVNHNLDRARGSYWRAWIYSQNEVYDSGSLWFRGLQQLYPTGIDGAASVNLTGTYSDVDDSPYLAASEADYLGATAAGAWQARLTFDTPTQALSTVGNDHTFVLRVDSIIGSNGRLTVRLYDGGTFKATLLDNEYVGSNGQDSLGRRVLVLPWSTSQLGTADGSGVQIQIEADDGVMVQSVLWVAGTDPESEFAGVVVGSRDTGWIPVSASDSDPNFGGLPPELVAGVGFQQTDKHVLSTQWTVPASSSATAPPRVCVALLSAAADDRLPYVGVVAAGTMWRPSEQSKNFNSFSLAVEDESKVAPTWGGQTLPSARARRRVATFTLPRTVRSEFAQLIERIDVRKGSIGAFLVSFYPDDPYLDSMTTFWCTLDKESMGAFVLSPLSGDTSEDTVPFRFDRSYTVREKL